MEDDFKCEFKVKEQPHGIYQIIAPMRENMYLVIGKSKAMLIDTGMGIGSLKTVVDKLTSLPLIVVNTHGHPDHAGGNIEFKECYMNKADEATLLRMCTKDFRYHDILKIFQKDVKVFSSNLLDFEDNTIELLNHQEFDLGGRVISTLYTPGHTIGSVILYDRKYGIIFSGDTFATLDNWLYLSESTNLHTYLDSLLTIKKECSFISRVYSGHLSFGEDGSALDLKITCVKRILANPDIGTYTKTFQGEGFTYEFKGSGVIYKKENL